MENLETFVNDEQLVDMALWVLVRDPDQKHAAEILICYAANRIVNQGGDPTVKAVKELTDALFLNYTKNMLVDEGYGSVTFDEDGPHYEFTPEGQEVLFAIVKSRYS